MQISIANFGRACEYVAVFDLQFDHHTQGVYAMRLIRLRAPIVLAQDDM